MKDEVKEIKRTRILDTALELFSKQGFSGTSMDAVADALGVTKPFIYTYFYNKYALLTALYERVTDQLVTILKDALENADDPPDQQLAFLLRQLARVNMNSQVASVFIQEEKHLDKRFLQSVRRREKEFDRRLCALIERGVGMGIFHVQDPALAGLAVTGMVRWIHRWYQPDGRLSSEEIGEQIANLALSTLGVRPKTAAAAKLAARRDESPPGSAPEHAHFSFYCPGAMTMARIPYVEKSDLSPANQDLLEKNYTAFRALANSPDCLRVFWGLGGYFQGGGLLAPRLRELVLLQIGCLSGCAYEWSHHVKIALAVGITEEEIRVVTSGMGQKSVAFSPVEHAALRATCEMYQGTEASAETVAELQRLLGPAALVELVVLIGLYIGMVRILSTLGVDVEPEYETYLQRFPLPRLAAGKA